MCGSIASDKFTEAYLQVLEWKMSYGCIQIMQISIKYKSCKFLVWMFCGKTNLKKLGKLQEGALLLFGRGLAIVYRDTSLNCCDLSKKSGQLSLRMNLLRLQAIEMFKCVNEINSEYMNDMFSLSESHYEFRNKNRLLQPKFHTYKYG